ncbi:MAG: AbrB/MazE/SpoVT family DNA-binding domain-containing protein [Deferrisomatales bacterium]
MAQVYDAQEVRIGPQGRVVIPAALRRALDLGEGQILVARAEGDRLVMETRQAILARLRRQFAAVPEGVDLADELIADRRTAALGEEGT